MIPRTPTALIIDDDELMRMMIAEALVPMGFHIIEAEDGEKGLAAFAETSPDLIFLDLLMPGIDGIEVCRRLRAMPAGHTLPIVMVTGQDDRDSIEQTFTAGATDFIAKPIAWAMLPHRIKFIMQSARAFQQVAQSQFRLNQAQRLAGLGSFEYDLDKRHFHPSASLPALIGFNGNENTRLRELRPLFSEAEWRQLANIGEQALQTGEVTTGELHNLAGRHFRVQMEPSGKSSLRGSLLDITELRSAQAQAAYLKHHDALTGLLNLVGYTVALEQEAVLAQRQQRNVPVLLIHLERLRRLRDGFGHTTADSLLKAAVGRLLKAGDARPLMPHIARITSDEIAVIIHEAAPVEAITSFAEQLLAELAAPFEIGGQTYHLQPHGGLALYPQDGDSSDAVLKAARTALQLGGQSERLLHFYDAERDAALTRRLRLEEDLIRARSSGQLELHYQPLVRVSDKQPVGVEALLRWKHPQLGMIPPTEFIPLAEENGLIHDIGNWVLQEACQQAARWMGSGILLNEMAINISGVQLADPNFVARVEHALRGSALDPRHLVLELTESVLVHEDELALQQLRALKSLGLRLALDDFGTGFSSMVSLTRLPIDIVKVDRSFVQAAPTLRTAAAVVEAILALASRLGMETVAEGVEDSVHFEFLTRFGCTTAQGYMFQKPQPAIDIVAHLGMANNAPLKVMVVDDSRLSRMMLSSLIKAIQPDAEVITIDDPRETAAAVARDTPNLVTLDMNMPGMSGMEVAQVLRASHPLLDIAMLTANFQDSVVQQAHNLKIRFFAKPITEAIVTEILAPHGRSS